ncbi:MAG: TldD/PmbA family protein [Acidobacteriota bacterium]
MQTPARARHMLERVLALVGTTKGVDAIATMYSERTGNTRFARNEITSSGDVERLTLSVTAQMAKRSATASTNQLDDRALDDLVTRVLHMVKLAPENPELMPPVGHQSYVKAPPASDPATAKLAPGDRAKAVGAAIGRGDAAKLAIAGFLEHSTSLVARASSAGLWAVHEATSCSYSCTARTADGTGSGWASMSSNKIGDLDAGALAQIAVDKATRSAHPRRLDPGRYTVVLEPAAVAALLGFLIGSLQARRADEGRSFFGKGGGATRVGDKLFPDTITLRSDPADAATDGMPFDGEGLALQPTRWIDKGVLTGLVYTRFWAQKQGKRPTGQPRGWTLDGGKATRDELIAGVQRGVLITRFWYLRDLDPQTILATGLTRDGTFLIENGKIVAPVNNFRFNESPIHMLASCDALGATSIPGGDQGAGLRAPILRTHDFNLASISEAV